MHTNAHTHIHGDNFTHFSIIEKSNKYMPNIFLNLRTYILFLRNCISNICFYVKLFENLTKL